MMEICLGMVRLVLVKVCIVFMVSRLLVVKRLLGVLLLCFRLVRWVCMVVKLVLKVKVVGVNVCVLYLVFFSVLMKFCWWL